MHNITQHAPIMLALLAHAHTSSGRPAVRFLCRHLDDTWSSPPSTSRCRGHRLRRASETKVETSRSAARYAWSWPRPRRPSPRYALGAREPRSSPGMGRGSLALLTSHGTRSLPCAPGARRPRSCPSTRSNANVSTTAGPPAGPARGYRSKNGEDPSSWARERLCTVIGTRPVKACGGFNLGVVVGSLN